MNFRMVFFNIGRILLVEAVLLVLPAIGSVIYGEDTLLAYALTIAALSVFGAITVRKKPEKSAIYAKDGYFIVALSWILMSFFGAMPFYLSGHIRAISLSTNGS